MVQKIAKEMIQLARQEAAQDVYLIPKSSCYELYMRVGDERRFIQTYDFDLLSSVISHFKFVSGMNVGEKRRSQLGSCDYDCGDVTVSLRLSTVGDYRGFYLFSGPVGSGKTTLMHQLAQMRFGQQQVMSIEDPVEIKQENMLQLQLNETIGMTYDSLIKLSLRHRPDLLIIGEIRDQETARAVVRASLTGATVFSTIHAKSIRGVYERLLELGVSEDELRMVLQGVCYQRLIGGGGVIDFVNQDYQKHEANLWNQQIDQLFADGHITADQRQAEKIIYA